MHRTVGGRYAIPRQRKSLVSRPRLLRKLHSGIGNGLTAVHAPVGFGKTALLAAFSRELADHFNVRWLTIDASAESPEVFAWQLATALSGDEVAPPATADKLDDLRAYLGVVLRRVDSEGQLPLLLIVDDIHHISESEESCEILGWLIENVHEGAEVILSGRTLPPLTLINMRIATGECQVIESADLAFSLEEIAVLLPEGSPLDAHDLLAATDGWPAAVMATIAGGMELPGHGLSRTNAAWEEYLSSQVWAAVPKPLREPLMRAAIPHIVSDQLGSRLLGRGQWLKLRRWLANNDFLYEPLEDDGLRLNPLLRRFLTLEYERTDPEGFAETVRDVVQCLELEGDIAGAIEIARDGGHIEMLMSLARTHSRVLLHQGAFPLLRRAYEAIPAEVLRSKPLLHAMYARILAHTGRPGEALDIVEELLAREDASREARIHALLAKYRALRLLGRTDELAGIFEAARDIGSTLDASLAAELAYHEAHLVLGLESDFKRAHELFREALDYCRVSRSPILELLTRSSLGQLLAMRGDCPAAVAELTRSARGWREVGGSSNLGWVLNNLGMAHLSVGDFESAVVALEEARKEGQACENVRNYAYATASLADAELARGRFDRAKEPRAHELLSPRKWNLRSGT